MPLAPVGSPKLGCCCAVNVVDPPETASGADEPVAPAPRARHATPPRGRARHRRTAAMLLLALLAPARRPRRTGREPAPAGPSGRLPDLASVPPRPQLSYTVAQRRRDRQRAGRRSRQRPLSRRRAGLRHRRHQGAAATAARRLPPPASRRAATADPGRRPGSSPAPTCAADLIIAADKGKLRQLMRRLEQRAPDPVGPATAGRGRGRSRHPDRAGRRGRCRPRPATRRPPRRSSWRPARPRRTTARAPPAAAKRYRRDAGCRWARWWRACRSARRRRRAGRGAPPLSSRRALDQARAANAAAADRRASRADGRRPRPGARRRRGSDPAGRATGPARRSPSAGSGDEVLVYLAQPSPLRESCGRPADSRGRRNVLRSRPTIGAGSAEIFAGPHP